MVDVLEDNATRNDGSCMFCHGELALRKPAARHLTAFFLMIALGGSLGGILVGVAAPLALRGFAEMPLALAACAVLFFLAQGRVRGAAEQARYAAFALPDDADMICRVAQCLIKVGEINAARACMQHPAIGRSRSGTALAGLAHIHQGLGQHQEAPEGASQGDHQVKGGQVTGGGLAQGEFAVAEHAAGEKTERKNAD